MVQWCPEMHIIRCIFNLKVTVSPKSMISVSHLVVTFGLAFVFSLSFRLGLGLPFLSPWREELGGHFMTFILRISCQKSRQSLWEGQRNTLSQLLKLACLQLCTFLDISPLVQSCLWRVRDACGWFQFTELLTEISLHFLCKFLAWAQHH